MALKQGHTTFSYNKAPKQTHVGLQKQDCDAISFMGSFFFCCLFCLQTADSWININILNWTCNETLKTKYIITACVCWGASQGWLVKAPWTFDLHNNKRKARLWREKLVIEK